VLQAVQAPLGRADQVLHRRVGLAHLGQHFLGRDPPVHQPHPPVLPLDPGQEVAQRRLVGRVAGQHLVGQGQAVGGHHQGDDHLYAVRPVVARVAEPALVALRKRRLRLEVGAGQIVEQDVEAGIEQVPPPARQVIEQRRLVLQQTIVAAVEFVDFRQAEIGTQQIRQRRALEPLPMQAPFAARLQQPIGNQDEQHLIPARPLATGGKPSGPEPVKPQLLPEPQRQPARSPLPWSAQTEFGQLQPDDRRIRQNPVTAILREQRQGPPPVAALIQDLDRLAPRQFLGVVDLSQVQQMFLHHAPAGNAPVLNNAPVAMLLPVFLPESPPQKHGGRSLSGTPDHRNDQGLHYSRFRPVSGIASSSHQWLSQQKNFKTAQITVESAKIG